jgi:predicted ATPase
MRDAIAWSYHLLDESERRLFRRLGVFVGGFTLEAAERVASDEGRAASGDGPPSPPATRCSLLDVVASLVDKSLVRRNDDTGEEPRFSMLETIREYALELLEASGEVQLIRRRHAAYYLALAEESEPELTGPKQARWLVRLEREHANLRAALRCLRDQGDVEWQGLRLAAALWHFWWLRSYFTEGRAQLRAFLVLAGSSAPSAVQAKALHAAGELST